MAVKKKDPFPVIAPAEDRDLHALQALAKGVASPGQQTRALRYILHISGVREMGVNFDNVHETYFHQGRRFVGYQISRLLELSGITPASENQKDA